MALGQTINGTPTHICSSCDSPSSSTIRFLHLQPLITCFWLWHQTDLGSAFHLYQSCHPEHVWLLLSTFTWILAHFVHFSHVFCLNRLTLVLHQPGRCISVFLSLLCMPDKPDLDPKSQGSMLSYLSRCQGLLTGSVASSECLFQESSLYWRV